MASLIPHDVNYSLVAIPLFYLLGVIPHGYSLHLSTGGRVAKHDNRNPRAEGYKENLKKKLPADIYKRWERSEAAHYNALEQFPLFAAVVLAGNLARLPIVDLNTLVFGMAALRSFYTLLYINTSQQAPTVLRTVVWFIMLGWLTRVGLQAGRALM